MADTHSESLFSPFHYEDFCRAVGQRQEQHPEWRYGQTVFNVLYFDGFDPEFADEIRGTALDPFYNDHLAEALLDALEKRWAQSSSDAQGSTPGSSSPSPFDRLSTWRARLAERADRIAFANLADDIRVRLPVGYSLYVNTNERRIVVSRKVT